MTFNPVMVSSSLPEVIMKSIKKQLKELDAKLEWADNLGKDSVSSIDYTKTRLILLSSIKQRRGKIAMQIGK
jgi:hypothetical protein